MIAEHTVLIDRMAQESFDSGAILRRFTYFVISMDLLDNGFSIVMTVICHHERNREIKLNLR